jgi:hypothetical protein
VRYHPDNLDFSCSASGATHFLGKRSITAQLFSGRGVTGSERNKVKEVEEVTILQMP